VFFSGRGDGGGADAVLRRLAEAWTRVRDRRVGRRPARPDCAAAAEVRDPVRQGPRRSASSAVLPAAVRRIRPRKFTGTIHKYEIVPATNPGVEG